MWKVSHKDGKTGSKTQQQTTLAGQWNCVTVQLMCNQISAAGKHWETALWLRNISNLYNRRTNFMSSFKILFFSFFIQPLPAKFKWTQRFGFWQRVWKTSVSGQRSLTFPTLEPIHDWKHFQGANKWFHLRSVKIRVNLGANQASSHATLCF